LAPSVLFVSGKHTKYDEINVILDVCYFSSY
jgi:hypothetical protein